MTLENNLFEQLERTESPFKRRDIIKSFLRATDLNPCIKTEKLTSEDSIPSDPKNKLSLPFAVGHKYQLNGPYKPPYDVSVVYVLGITERENLLVISRENNISLSSRIELLNP